MFGRGETLLHMVARAICRCDRGSHKRTNWQYYLPEARAAIETIEAYAKIELKEEGHDPFPVGTEVTTAEGYPFLGTVVATFTMLSGARCYVVECTAVGASGSLHIFNETSLRIR